MSPYATIALLALVLSVAAQNAVQTNVKANVNWDKSSNAAVGNINVNGKTTPFTVSISGNANQQPTFTIQSQNPAGKTTTVKIIPIKPITSPLPQQTHPTETVNPVHHDVPVPIQSAAPVPVPVPMPSVLPVPVPVPMPAVQPAKPAQPVVSVRTTTFTATSSEPNKPTVTVRTQTVSNSMEPNKPVTVTVISVAKPEPIKGDPSHFNHPTPNTVPTPPPTTVTSAVAVGVPEPYLSNVNCDNHEFKHHPECRDRHHEEKKRKGCNKRLWIKGCILGLAAFGALAFLALCCRICRGRSSCCCRRRHQECEKNPTYGIPAPIQMNAVGQPQQVFVVQAQPVNDPYFQPTPTHTNRSGQPFVQLNETHPDVSANYVIGYPQAHEQPIYMVPQRN
jgi:hypothetical protein